jgi:preprotein translocase subunit SecE
VARNRKRRSDSRPHRPGTGPMAEPGVATASGSRRGVPDAPRPEAEELPDPIEHGTPDVELAEAQLALGRPELAGEAPSDEELTEEALGGGGGGGGRGRRSRGGDGGGGGGDGEPAESGPSGAAALPARRQGGRLIHFVQGSWRELQRVQWPDRRQVAQATGVVIGFVIVAGVFLGLADLVANKVVTLILK